MKKSDLVERIASDSGITKTQAAAAVQATLDSIRDALGKGDRVVLSGFGTFSAGRRKARNGRNPQTGPTIKIAARRVAKFKPGGKLKSAVNRKAVEKDAFISALEQLSQYY